MRKTAEQEAAEEARLKGKPVEEILERFARTGNKVAVTRMELFNDGEELIAVGTAAYTLS